MQKKWVRSKLRCFWKDLPLFFDDESLWPFQKTRTILIKAYTLCLGSSCFGLETRIIIKILTHPCYPQETLTDFHKNEAKKKKNPKSKMADSKKVSFSTTSKSWAIVAKILQIGPWVSRINWCKGHSFCSTYMVVRLSDRSSIYCKKH